MAKQTTPKNHITGAIWIVFRTHKLISEAHFLSRLQKKSLFQGTLRFDRCFEDGHRANLLSAEWSRSTYLVTSKFSHTIRISTAPISKAFRVSFTPKQ